LPAGGDTYRGPLRVDTAVVSTVHNRAVSTDFGELPLLIGLVNLWFAVIRPWWRNRKASPAAQLDLLRYPAQSGGRWQEEERVVVTNHGPARMRNVSVEVFDQDGRPLAEGLTALWPKMPVEVLHVGQSGRRAYSRLRPEVDPEGPGLGLGPTLELVLDRCGHLRTLVVARVCVPRKKVSRADALRCQPVLAAAA
jgi:hypothetical protein